MTGKRVLYQEPQATFFHDVMTNLFTDKMTKAATYYNLHPSMGHRTKRFFQWSGKMGERF